MASQHLIQKTQYVRFLADATVRIFLRKVGGKYIFVHRMLLEYFAARHQLSIEQQNATVMGNPLQPRPFAVPLQVWRGALSCRVPVCLWPLPWVKMPTHHGENNAEREHRWKR